MGELRAPSDCPLSPLSPLTALHPYSRLAVPAGFLLATILGTACLAIASGIYLLVGSILAVSLSLKAGPASGAHVLAYVVGTVTMWPPRVAHLTC